MTSDVFPVRSARRKRAQIAQHGLAALMLVTYAIDHFSRPQTGLLLLGAVEIAAAMLLIAAVVRERLNKAHRGIAWVEFAGALMASVEAVERTRGRHHVSFIILSYFAPLLLLAFALFDARISAMRYLKADDDSFEVRLRLLIRRRVRWDAVRTFRVAGNAIECQMADGSGRRFSLRDLVDRDAALAWSAEQFRRHGVSESAQ